MLSVACRALIRCSWDAEITNYSSCGFPSQCQPPYTALLKTKFYHCHFDTAGVKKKKKKKIKSLISKESDSGCGPHLRERAGARAAAKLEGLRRPQSREEWPPSVWRLSLPHSHPLPSLHSLCCLPPGSLHPELPEGTGLVCHHLPCHLHPGLPLSEKILC